ncbi:MAG: diaminopimelate epimerase [Candidatus Methanoplasma sp.]|jgi:diaminopimelate epimerase|nr:diaminopimelate epimerase [Candidatus Methanoplasma sp.]
MRFWKYHGIGNDFVLLDGSSGDLKVDKKLSRKLCDRHYGIGADGVLYILPGKNTDITMRIINADGSEAEMCGNGIRCVAKHVYDSGIVKKEEFTIHTLAGDLKTRVNLKDGEVDTVTINMGAPILDGRSVPIDYDGRYIDQPFETDGYSFRGNAVSMGNPHFITFADLTDKDTEFLGPIIETHPFFPRKTNVEFCRVSDGKIHIKVYERGAAWTLACGTGACASTVAAALNKLVPFGRPVDVHLPGGWLKITVDKDMKYVLMEGPAELVYEGNIETK